MKAAKWVFYLQTVFFVVSSISGNQVMGAQSLADAARKEAERRKLLEQQGIEGKVIGADEDGSLLAPAGNLTVSKLPRSSPAPTPNHESKQPASGRKQQSLSAIRTRLEKLDRSIVAGEERIRMLQDRLRSERWAPPKVGRISKQTGDDNSLVRLQRQIDELQMKLKHFRQERAEIYEAGKKSGYLPGELEGKGIIP